MKQVLIKKKGVVVEDIPAPLVDNDGVLVEVAYSLISAGTEIASVVQQHKSLIQQAVDQPEKVLKLVDHLRRHGLKKTVSKLQGRLEGGTPLGYSCAGIVLQVGRHISDLRPGDRVACGGAGHANHAEVVRVPRQLVVKIPEGCELREAASVTLGAIAMQGVRRADPRLGEMVAVIGLGLLGQITVQLLHAAGCRVFGADPDVRRVELARRWGLEAGFSGDGAEIRQLTGGHGVDSTIITAATPGSEVVQQAMEITRKKGRVVVVGAVGLALKRAPFYEKEIDFLISCSYGPGRYDPHYEEQGVDYPYAWVRWTENRNMAEYLRLVASGQLNIRALIEREFPVGRAPEAYVELQTATPRPLGVVLAYAASSIEPKRKTASRVDLKPFVRTGRIKVAVVGAGGFAKGMHLPNLQKLAHLYHLRAVVSATGTNAKATALQFGADYATTNYDEVLADPEVDLVLICTRHHLHAAQAIAAAQAGKAIFLEKPMALNQLELDQLKAVLEETQVPCLVGFNRRFSLYADEIRRHTALRRNPLFIHYRMNAGFIPPDHWVHGPEGGGRIIGEACHLIDLFTSFTAATIRSVSTHRLAPRTEAFSADDNVAVTLEYEEGSVAVLEYLAVGSRQFPKEYMEIHFDEKTLVLDDYRSLRGYDLPLKAISTGTSEKGQYQELVAFHAALTAKDATKKYPIPLWDLFQTTQATFAIANREPCAE